MITEMAEEDTEIRVCLPYWKLWLGKISQLANEKTLLVISRVTRFELTLHTRSKNHNIFI